MRKCFCRDSVSDWLALVGLAVIGFCRQSRAALKIVRRNPISVVDSL
jgi:hypothetical protein